MIREDRLVDLFKTLCQIDAPPRQERASVDWTKRYLAQIPGLEIWEDDAGEAIGGNANNLIARLPANVEGQPRIFLSAHFDTVEPTAGLTILERDGVFTSDGTTILGADDKGGMAPAIEAVHAIAESGTPHGDIYLLFSVAEEIGLLGADALKIEDLDLDYGYVLDTGPPVGTFVTRAGTHDKLTVTIRGVPAHAGKEPEKGVSAIEVAAAAIHGMCLGRIDAETTANIGIIEGGTAVNVVCPEVKLRAEARSMDVAKLDLQVDHMVRRFESVSREKGATVQIEHGRHYSGYRIDEASEVVQRAWKASESLGMTPKCRETLGGSDANVFNAKGVPCIVLGTGMDKIHTHEEKISRKDLVDTARLVVNLLTHNV